MITDEMMTAAAEELYQALLTSLPDEDLCDYRFSEGFERKMKRLIRQAEHPLRHRVLQRAASIVLVMFLGFVALLSVSPTVRATVFGWVREQCENYAAYHMELDCQHSQNQAIYELGYLPEGFEETHRSTSPNETNVYYTNNTTNEIMRLTYSYVEGDYAYHLEIENYRIEEVMINGGTGEFYENLNTKGANAIIWTDDSSNALFCISAFMDKTDLIYLAENLKELP